MLFEEKVEYTDLYLLKYNIYLQKFYEKFIPSVSITAAISSFVGIVNLHLP